MNEERAAELRVRIAHLRQRLNDLEEQYPAPSEAWLDGVKLVASIGLTLAGIVLDPPDGAAKLLLLGTGIAISFADWIAYADRQAHLDRLNDQVREVLEEIARIHTQLDAYEAVGGAATDGRRPRRGRTRRYLPTLMKPRE